MLFLDLNFVYVDTLHKPPLALLDHDIVPTHLSLAHPAILGECPVLQPITPLPLHLIVGVLVFIPELDGNLIGGKSKELFPQTVRLFFGPLCGQEVDDLVGATEE